MADMNLLERPTNWLASHYMTILTQNTVASVEAYPKNWTVYTGLILEHEPWGLTLVTNHGTAC